MGGLKRGIGGGGGEYAENTRPHVEGRDEDEVGLVVVVLAMVGAARREGGGASWKQAERLYRMHGTEREDG